MEEINNKFDLKLKELLNNSETQVKEIEALNTRIDNNENQTETDIQNLNAKLEDIEGKLKDFNKTDDSKDLGDKVKGVGIELKEYAKRTDSLADKLEAIKEQISIELNDKQKQNETDTISLKNELETHIRFIDEKLNSHMKECIRNNETQMKNAIEDINIKLNGTEKKLTDKVDSLSKKLILSLIHICRCRRYAVCRSRWSPYH
eukprot:TRINITY_DN13530_c0_g1_i4.p1 TRINITY_DN13530_c0_g1~~TRINITY_DN13530_c0_g1_i4.p1  ORF type:complete len:204 (-),score=48.09 TRINITY_DN13530_c0_g1_i4:12-623(-)